MRRLVTILGVVLLIVLAAGLYRLKYEVQALEAQHAALNRAILGEEEAIRVLKAEWSYLNHPRRLAELIEQHLELGSATVRQLATFGDVPYWLPEVAEPKPATRAVAAKRATAPAVSGAQPASTPAVKGVTQ